MVSIIFRFFSGSTLKLYSDPVLGLDKKQFQFLDTIKGKNVKVKTLASLRSDKVADFTGISGRFPLESPAGFDWNAWPISPEYTVSSLYVAVSAFECNVKSNAPSGLQIMGEVAKF